MRVHGAGFGAEAGDAVAASLGGAELKGEDGAVERGEDGEVIGHFLSLTWEGSRKGLRL